MTTLGPPGAEKRRPGDDGIPRAAHGSAASSTGTETTDPPPRCVLLDCGRDRDPQQRLCPYHRGLAERFAAGYTQPVAVDRDHTGYPVGLLSSAARAYRNARNAEGGR